RRAADAVVRAQLHLGGQQSTHRICAGADHGDQLVGDLLIPGRVGRAVGGSASLGRTGGHRSSSTLGVDHVVLQDLGQKVPGAVGVRLVEEGGRVAVLQNPAAVH